MLDVRLITKNLNDSIIDNANKLSAHSAVKSIQSPDQSQYKDIGIVIDHPKNTLSLNELEQIHLQEQLNIKIIDEVISFIDFMTDHLNHARDCIDPHYEVFNESKKMGEVRNYLVDLQKKK